MKPSGGVVGSVPTWPVITSGRASSPWSDAPTGRSWRSSASTGPVSGSSRKAAWSAASNRSRRCGASSARRPASGRTTSSWWASRASGSSPSGLADVVGDGARLGQVHRWFELRVRDDDIEPRPDGREFRAWQWVTPAWLVDNVVEFRRPAYRQVLGGARVG